MASRTNWKGYLKLSLVSCGVALFPATSTSPRTRFNIVNRKTGNRVRYQQVDSETGQEVPEGDRVKGYKVADGSYVLVQDKELDEVALERAHTIDIEAFVRSVQAKRETGSTRRGQRDAPPSGAKTARRPAAKGKRLKRAS
ncbi:MAG: Ku protein [Xanthobacteraceae bacterium]